MKVGRSSLAMDLQKANPELYEKYLADMIKEADDGWERIGKVLGDYLNDPSHSATISQIFTERAK